MAALPLPPELAVPSEPFTEEDLDLAVDAIERGEVPPARVGNFVIDDLGKADWCGRKWAAYTDELDEIESLARQQHDAIDAWAAAQQRRLSPRIAIFAEALRRYAINRRADDESRKTLNLPSVVVRTTRSKSPVVHIGNEEQVLAWAEKALDPAQEKVVVKRTAKVLISELRKLVSIPKGKSYAVLGDTGEVVPGCYVTPPDTTATVSSP